MFTCSGGYPTCISLAQTCNKYPDCAVGSDEDAKLCGES